MPAPQTNPPPGRPAPQTSPPPPPATPPDQPIAMPEPHEVGDENAQPG